MLEFYELTILSIVYILSLLIIFTLMWREFKKHRFSFYLLFSLVYVLVFYLGFPFSMGLMYKYHIQLQSFSILFLTQLTSIGFYLIYHFFYQCNFYPRLPTVSKIVSLSQQNSTLSAKATAYTLLIVSLISMLVFYSLNGLLLFKLTAYNQIFSAQVNWVALKRFFYFFLPALLIFYFLQQTKQAWWRFLFFSLGFGLFSYLVIGGTRANLALAAALFLFIGIVQGYISVFSLIIIGVFSIFAMFSLALYRYGLSFADEDILFRFLHLTRDTFSPWENVARLLNEKSIDFQGLMPIVRDFYVYIPKTLWAERPDLVWNTANYFTWEVLHYYAGLAISPTLIGSFYIMGGYPMIIAGAIFSALIIKGFDGLYFYAKQCTFHSQSAVLKSYCFAHIFTLTVLVREGIDAFISRFVFLSVIFILCYVIGQGIMGLYLKLKRKNAFKE
ncbi:enterobacterial common antigen polymerase [Pasteurellaceae bacterium Pebbles2]|nr:enterobacterial common antigen polymerase [Pasteurellaceae bacterium Pebbles2]